MKNTKIIATLIALVATGIIVFISCNKKNSSTAPASTTTKTTRTAAHRFNGTFSNYPDVITKSEANSRISAYINDNNKNSVTSFLYDPAELLSYINNCDNLTNINILIGEYTDANNNTKLCLIFCGVDNTTGNHIYLTDANNTEYALDQTYPCPTCSNIVNNGSNLETPGVANTSYTGSYTQNISVSSAQTFVSNYINSNSKNTTATSFLYPASVLASYINNATGITKLHFFLAQDGSGNLKLIISGIDSNGNHIFINDGDGHYFALDQSYPCPTCDGVSGGGTSLE